jgi:cell shape-determining protein MreC
MQDKAVRFLRDVIGDPDRADEFEAMSPEEYAEHKRVAIENPSQRTKRRLLMRRPTYDDLKDRVAELEEENQALSEKLDSISDIASTEEDEDDEEEDEEEGDDDLD